MHNGEIDAVVIGAGYTGVAAARRLAERCPGNAIALLDASTVGEGNPGRNSGFLLEVALAHDADTANMSRMRRCNELLQQTMQSIVDDVASAAINCELTRSGTYRAAAGTQGMQALNSYQSFLENAGLPCETLNRDQLAARLGTDFYRAGLYSPHCYLVQPAALIRGLCQLLPANVTLYENSPALRIARLRDRWQVETPEATFTTRQVLVANNAFCKGLGIGKSRIAAMYTYAAMTEPVPSDILHELGSEPSWGLLPAHRLGSTLRRTADGRFLIRSLYAYEKEAPAATIELKLRDALSRRFPRLGSIPFEALWSGATGFTFNGAPLWGEVKPGLFVSAGCNGGGVVKGTLFGKLLADLACGETTPDIDGLFGRASWMPPEPVRRAGFELISRIEQQKGRAEV